MSAVNSEWYNSDRTIIITTYSGEYGWNEVHKAVRSANLLAQTVNYPVAVIIDLTHAYEHPTKAPSYGRRLQEMRCDNIHFEVVIESKMWTDTFTDITRKMLKYFSRNTSSFFAHSIESAVKLVNSKFLYERA